MKRTEIINAVIEAIGATSYLEVGVRNPADNFDGIKCADKTGVDLSARSEHIMRMSSDEFFAATENVVKWDVIFVDADHSHEQSKVDAINAFQHVTKGGVVVLHDTSPVAEWSATPAKPDNGAAWNGEVWKTAAYYRTLKTFRIWTVDTDHGVTIIQRGRHDDVIPAIPDTFAAFEADKRFILNLLPPDGLGHVLEQLGRART